MIFRKEVPGEPLFLLPEEYMVVVSALIMCKSVLDDCIRALDNTFTNLFNFLRVSTNGPVEKGTLATV